MDELKIIYYTDDSTVPYLIKLNITPEKARLKDFKEALNLGTAIKNTKFFFQSIVDDFGTVKEEVSDDDALLPSIKGRVVAWLIQVDENKSNQIVDNKNNDQHSNIENYDSNRQRQKRDGQDTLSWKKNKNSRAQINPLKYVQQINKILNYFFV